MPGGENRPGRLKKRLSEQVLSGFRCDSRRRRPRFPGGLAAKGCFPGSQSVIELCTPTTCSNCSLVSPSRNSVAIGDRQTRTPRRQRRAHCHAPVFPFRHLSAVSTYDACRMLALLGKAGVIHDPGHHRSLLLHGWQHLLTHMIEQGLVAPARLGRRITRGLACGLNLARVELRRHGLDAFPPGLRFRAPVQVFAPQRPTPVRLPPQRKALLWSQRSGRARPGAQPHDRARQPPRILPV